MMFDILSVIPGRKKATTSGWHSFNAVCCHNRGHKADRRGRGGIIFADENNWSYHCFNCGFKCGFTLGKSISKHTKELLNWCGIDDAQIGRWNLESLQHKDILDFTPKKKKIKVKFKEMTLPDGELLDPTNRVHHKFIEYLDNRHIAYDSYPFMVTPNDVGRMANRIIIPFTFDNKIVGHTSRFIDDRTPKYLNEQQPGYLFGYDFQKPDWEVCIVVEGIFDALSIDGCAYAHDEISEEQASLLKRLNRKIIVVPDQDKTGLKFCNKALDMGFHVSLPNWHPGVKDVNDAVIKYGKLPTLLSILQSATNNKIKIELQRKKIDKRL